MRNKDAVGTKKKAIKTLLKERVGLKGGGGFPNVQFKRPRKKKRFSKRSKKVYQGVKNSNPQCEKTLVAFLHNSEKERGTLKKKTTARRERVLKTTEPRTASKKTNNPHNKKKKKPDWGFGPEIRKKKIWGGPRKTNTNPNRGWVLGRSGTGEKVHGTERKSQGKEMGKWGWKPSSRAWVGGLGVGKRVMRSRPRKKKTISKTYLKTEEGVNEKKVLKQEPLGREGT